MVMKRVVQLEKLISRGIERVARRGAAAPDPLEWIQPMLDELAAHVTPSGGRGRHFPHDSVTVEVRGTDAHVASARDALARLDLKARVTERLGRARCTPPESLVVRVRYKVLADPVPADEPGYRLICKSAAPDRAAAPASAAADWLELTVLAGRTGQRVYLLDGDRVRIGRLPTVEGRRPEDLRRNDVAFLDDSDPVNSAVSRAHAHVRRSPTGEFRVFDDRSSHGTRVLRRGMDIPVPAGDRRGVRLEPDDVLLLGGHARLRVRMRPATARGSAKRP